MQLKNLKPMNNMIRYIFQKSTLTRVLENRLENARDKKKTQKKPPHTDCMGK